MRNAVPSVPFSNPPDTLQSLLTSQRRRRRPPGPLGLLRRWADSLRSSRVDERSSADVTTLPPPSRGQALRDAHRNLRERLRAHDAIRRVLPHLAFVERHMARKGSAALHQVPIRVLQRSVEQLAILQRDDESPDEALHMQVLRIRLEEAIDSRGNDPNLAPTACAKAAAAVADEPDLNALDDQAAVVSVVPDAGSSLGASGLPSSAFGDVAVLVVDEPLPRAPRAPRPPRRH